MEAAKLSKTFLFLVLVHVAMGVAPPPPSSPPPPTYMYPTVTLKDAYVQRHQSCSYNDNNFGGPLAAVRNISGPWTARSVQAGLSGVTSKLLLPTASNYMTGPALEACKTTSSATKGELCNVAWATPWTNTCQGSNLAADPGWASYVNITAWMTFDSSGNAVPNLKWAFGYKLNNSNKTCTWGTSDFVMGPGPQPSMECRTWVEGDNKLNCYGFTVPDMYGPGQDYNGYNCESSYTRYIYKVDAIGFACASGYKLDKTRKDGKLCVLASTLPAYVNPTITYKDAYVSRAKACFYTDGMAGATAVLGVSNLTGPWTLRSVPANLTGIYTSIALPDATNYLQGTHHDGCGTSVSPNTAETCTTDWSKGCPNASPAAEPNWAKAVKVKAYMAFNNSTGNAYAKLDWVFTTADGKTNRTCRWYTADFYKDPPLLVQYECNPKTEGTDKLNCYSFTAPDMYGPGMDYVGFNCESSLTKWIYKVDAVSFVCPNLYKLVLTRRDGKLCMLA